MTSVRVLLTCACLALLSLPSAAFAQTCPMVLDFDTDGDGNPILAGQDLANAYASWGITSVTWNSMAMITPGMGIAFDSANPTGGDFDLQTPGYGYANTNALGNLKISAENFVDANNDGLIDDPDDDASGAWFEFFFNAPTCIYSVDLIDIEANEQSPDILAYDANGAIIQWVTAQSIGDNSVQTVDLNGICGVDHIMIDVYGSGAIDNLEVCVGGTDEVCDGIDNDGDGSIDEGVLAVEEAVVDPAVYGGGGGHAITLFGFGAYMFDTPGEWEVDASTGTATITGTAHRIGDPADTFSISTTLAGYTTVAGSGSPKKELYASAYTTGGGTVDTSTWHYYSITTGTLTGTGTNTGNNFSFSRMGPAFQVGYGANGKNTNYGASGWLNWTRTAGSGSGSGTGDWNIDLNACVEVCDGIDNDQDGTIDEGFDDDNDGWTSCGGDCDDTDAAINPGATDICNGIDDDCDGSIDEDFDLDGDGYTTCNGDCDDTDASVNPGATEICDGVDNDCDGSVDEGFDQDNDGWTTCAGDCDDNNPNANPACPDICNGIDDDCDGSIDEDFDLDGDGYTTCNGDCADTDAAINPGAAEVCNGVDDDCDGVIPIDEIDVDGDGVAACDGDCAPGDGSVGPNEPETCNGVDDDCDGAVDEGFDADNDGVVDCVDSCPMIVDFDTDPYGNPIAAGTDLSETYAAWGIHSITWTVQNMSVVGMGIAFDSANPTGGDTDLATPGSGVGNTTALGNLMIGAENTVDANNDGLVDDPDDNASGAWIEFDFDDASCVTSLDFIDIEVSEGPADVFLYDANGAQVAHYQVPGLGDNSVQTLTMGDCGVHSMLIDIYGSGAIDNLDVCVGGGVEVCDGIDNDGDGAIDEDFDNDNDGWTTCAGDCDDNNPNANPACPDVCNGIDDDCDGSIDEDWDQDGDGYTTCAGDCDDTDASVNPGATEVCNGVDDDCDGTVDEGFDGDGDGFTSCDGDCDDDDAAIHPDAAEVCDGVDNNCDGNVDEGFDQDNDGWTTCAGDCDDNNPNANPACPDICNGIDDDCDGSIDEDFDQDNDGYTSCNGDCDDTNPNVNPSCPEACNGIDDDCDGAIDEGFPDGDGDGVTVCAGDCDDNDDDVYPGAPEICNGTDDDCNGVIDDGFDADGDGISDCIDTCPMVLDFDNDPFGSAIDPGDSVFSEYWAWGVFSIEEFHDSAMQVSLEPIAWDSENPPDALAELGTPNSDFGGPGVGSGGGAGAAGENDTGLGNVVKTTAGNTWYIVNFNSATCVHSIDLLDVDGGELAAQVILFDVNVNTIATYTSAALGDNSVETLELGDTCGVYVMMIDFYAQGAWDNLDICVDPSGGPEVCDDGIDNDGDGDVDEGCGGSGDDDDDDDDEEGYDADCSTVGSRVSPSWALLGFFGVGVFMRRRR